MTLIHHVVTGHGRPPIVFVHGFACAHTDWDAQVAHLSPRHQTVAVDLRGHGASPGTAAECSIERYGADVAEVMRALALPPVVLVGHSMGTTVIRQYARMYPSEVAALVPVDGLVHPPASTNAPNPDRMKGPDGLKNREAMIRGMFGKSATPAIQDQILKMMLAAQETTACQAMTATFAAPNWTEEAFTVPVLGIYADHSAADDPAYFKKIFPKGSTVEVPGTGHFVMIEKPRDFNELLADFLPRASF